MSREFGALRAVDGVTLSVARGARHALIGPNGAGKSTLLRLVAGGLPVSGGRIHLGDVDVTRAPEARRAWLGIGQTFQQSSLFGSQTVADNVALAVQRRRGRPWLPVPHRRPAWAARVDELLARVGLADRAGDPADALSYAECRQLEVAVALAAEPRLLLLDEPAAGMSTAGTARLLDLLRALPDDITVVFVEHDLDLVFELATVVTVLHLGKVLMSGTPAEVRASADVQRAYLGTARRADLFITEPSPGGDHVTTRP
ncbi:ABC transporter ATP-binding protein [Virgisporangium aurantiacum]|uniref:ABC transporter ATP-binding protein n=1 Tax=Virgisporangium aurantiacum TaxID=175570 RepID=UPI0019526D51|nr:ABC transporter ATP-binding protein [Virgisporangium aurantiacum]